MLVFLIYNVFLSNLKESDLREEEVSHNEEEERAPHENVIVVLLDICKGCWTGLRYSDVHDEVAEGTESHDFTSEGYWQDLSGICPSCAVDHSIYDTSVWEFK